MAKRVISRKLKKESKRNQHILTAIVVIILVGSMLGIMANTDSEVVRYNNLKFTPLIEERGFVTKINGEEMFFLSLPQDSKQIEMPQNSCQVLKNSQKIDILFEPNARNIMFVELVRKDLQNIFQDKLIEFFITEESENYPLYGISSCDNASINNPIIYFKESDNLSISFEDNCLIAEARDNNIWLIRDRLLYCYYGVLD
jgi:hypothetical protein